MANLKITSREIECYALTRTPRTTTRTRRCESEHSELDCSCWRNSVAMAAVEESLVRIRSGWIHRHQADAAAAAAEQPHVSSTRGLCSSRVRVDHGRSRAGTEAGNHRACVPRWMFRLPIGVLYYWKRNFFYLLFINDFIKELSLVVGSWMWRV